MRPILALLLAPSLAHAEPCEKADASLPKVNATDATIGVCYTSCWKFDVASHTWSHTDVAPKDFVESTAPPFPDPPPSTNVDLAAKAIWTDAGKRAQLELFVHDKRVAVIPNWEITFSASMNHAYFIGDTLLASAAKSPISETERMFDGRTGKLLGKVGGGKTIGGEPIHLTGNEWLIAGGGEADDNGATELWVHDIKTGRLVHTLSLLPPKEKSKIPLAASALVRVTSTHVIVMHGDAHLGIILYDIAKHTDARYTIPTCK